MKKIIFAFTFIIALGGAIYIVYREGILPVDKNDTSKKTIVVKQGDTVNAIANTLHVEKLIRNRLVFYSVVKQLGIDKQIQAGDFELSPSMDAFEIANSLTKGSLDVWVTVPEGLRKEEVAEVLAKQFDNFSSAEFLSKAEEGYLFPDTYLIPKSANADTVLAILDKTFHEKYNTQILAKAKAKNMTEKEVIILASLIEREVKNPEDRQPVASVFIRRLDEPMRLQVDATVQYALGYQKDIKSWWKRPLYFEDLKVDSAYNTYERDGLPLGPISNPGIAALEAVVDADAKTPYLFYVNDAEGKIHFAKTLEEHEKNIEKYVNK